MSMMGTIKGRKQYTPELKSKVALAAIKGRHHQSLDYQAPQAYEGQETRGLGILCAA